MSDYIVSSKVVSEPTPSAIQFAEVFWRLMGAAVTTVENEDGSYTHSIGDRRIQEDADS